MHVCLLQPDSQLLCCVCISLCHIYLCRPTAHHESLTGRLLSQVCYIFSPNKGMCVYATWSIQWSIAKCIAVPRADIEEWTWNQKALTKVLLYFYCTMKCKCKLVNLLRNVSVSVPLFFLFTHTCTTTRSFEVSPQVFGSSHCNAHCLVPGKSAYILFNN